jgi:rsbT co-antagonist protein RsbR
MTKQRVTTVILGILIGGTILFAITWLVAQQNLSLIAITGVALALWLGILAAHRRGWRWSAQATTIGALAVTLASADPAYLKGNFCVPIFIPTVVAAVLLTPTWSLAVFGVMLLGAALNVGVSAGSFGAEMLGPTFDFQNLLTATLVVIGIATASAVARHAQGVAENNAQRAEAEKVRAEQQARELAEANERMNDQLAQQRQLIDLVATLETPAVPLAEGVLLAPIVGHIDTRRALALTSRLLEQAAEQRARLVVLDIAGVTLIDTAVAQALLNTAQALRLLGCDVTLSGISANVAMTLIQLGVSMEGITTVRSPQEALSPVLAVRE